MSTSLAQLEITICMGSSCFSRGNNRNIEVLQDVLQRSGTAARCQLVGHLCQGQCKSGPNIMINGKLYSDVDPVALVTILNHHLAQAADPNKSA